MLRTRKLEGQMILETETLIFTLILQYTPRKSWVVKRRLRPRPATAELLRSIDVLSPTPAPSATLSTVRR